MTDWHGKTFANAIEQLDSDSERGLTNDQIAEALPNTAQTSWSKREVGGHGGFYGISSAGRWS